MIIKTIKLEEEQLTRYPRNNKYGFCLSKINPIRVDMIIEGDEILVPTVKYKDQKNIDYYIEQVKNSVYMFHPDIKKEEIEIIVFKKDKKQIGILILTKESEIKNRTLEEFIKTGFAEYLSNYKTEIIEV